MAIAEVEKDIQADLAACDGDLVTLTEQIKIWQADLARLQNMPPPSPQARRTGHNRQSEDVNQRREVRRLAKLREPIEKAIATLQRNVAANQSRVTALQGKIRTVRSRRWRALEWIEATFELAIAIYDDALVRNHLLGSVVQDDLSGTSDVVRVQLG